MPQYMVALLKGDGIGPEITDQAVKVLISASKRFGFELSFKEADIGGIAYNNHGTPLPNDTVAICKSCDAVLLGAVGGPQWDSLDRQNRPESGLLGIRKALGLFANLRPVTILPPLKNSSPIKPEIIGDGIDIMTVRELTGGIYFGNKGKTVTDGVRAAFDTEQYSEPEIERIARLAFSLAKKRRGVVTSVDKANVLESSALWRDVVSAVHCEFPDIVLNHMYVDNCAMQLIRDPGQFDVIVTSNMFGDILSDEASVLSGSIGLLPSASLGAEGTGLYEPIHGSAPEIAGQDTANPVAAILSAAMMLRYSFGNEKAAEAIENAVCRVLEKHRTPDIYETGRLKSACSEIGTLIADIILTD